MQLTDDIRQQYETLYAGCAILDADQAAVNAVIPTITANQNRYQNVSDSTGVPWYVVAAIHNLEASLDFNCHLYNGDPLTARTVHVPAGQPTVGDPPFTWEQSAIGALQYDGFTTWTDWTLAGMLYKLESYNGFGYRDHGINTPYLWSFSNNYTSGKYVADGSYDPSAVSDQCGAASVFIAMQAQGLINLSPNTSLTLVFQGNATTVPCLLIGDSSWVGLRDFAALVGGTIESAVGTPLAIDLNYQGQDYQLVGSVVTGAGFVKIDDLEPIYALTVQFNGPAGQLIVTQ